MPIKTSPLSDSLHEAFDRLEAFEAVQRAQRGGLTLDAVLALQAAAEIGDAERAAIAQRLPAVSGAAPGAVLLGVLVGLLATQAQE